MRVSRKEAMRAYLCLIVGAGAVAQVWWLYAWHGGVPENLGLQVLLLALAVVAQHFPIAIAPKRKVDVSVAAYFAALLLFGSPLAVALVGLSQLLGQFTLALRRNSATGKRLRTARSALFNTGQAMVATGLAGAAYYAFLPHVAPAPLDSWMSLVAIPAAAAMMYLTNTLAVAIMAGLQLGTNPLNVWSVRERRNILEFAGLFVIGVVVARAGAYDALLVLAMALPAAIIYWSMHRIVRIEQLARSETELTAWRDLERMRAEFMQSLSHELRAPLALVIGFSELLHRQSKATPSDPDTAQFTEQIHANALLLKRLLDDLLDFSRIERGEIAIEPRSFDLVPVLQDLVIGLRRQPGGERLNAPLPASLSVYADPARVSQVVYNLLANAQKYAPDGLIVLRATLAKANADGHGPIEMVRVEVEDHGPGIPHDEQAHVWEKFYRGNAVRGFNIAQGTGIGLSIVKALVEAQGGRVGLESTPGEGSCFWIELPAGEPEVKADRTHVTARLAGAQSETLDPRDPSAAA